MCDSSQETLIPRSGAGLRRTVAVSDSMHPMRKSNSSNGLVIFNENGEIDDTFLYEDDYFEMQVPKLNTDGIPVSARVMNGGVLSRREQKQREKLTREEVSSWEVFDQALKEKETLACSQASSIAAAAAAVNSQSLDEAQDKTTKRKRRKRLVDRTSSPPLQLETTTATQSSRITSLISELKTAKKQHTSQTSLLQAPPPSQTPHIPKYTAQSSITSESTSTSLANSPMESVSYSSSDDNEYVIPKRELSFDEKSIIQKYLRSKLKCRYKPGDCSSNYISNEEQFIKINKKISRKIYSHIVNSTCEIEEYFKNECKLRDVIDGYIET
ncbi:hypothetical protein KGF56_000754 [Candida oxycetoniae]|uniref:Uncharacterized protein n=1 Tax=Candida oxycetoniae TaxID=497107 RepID=A0AAI9T0C5_9ASCO|nr:uncharacterized protein KGF56_000754 [Candida oxycetoniae]KAI3406274.2 hypothetical protein KGF56_000754 [Candida oxycetoniae]